MHLVILHYHLNRGGVTQVIQNHLRAWCALSEGRPERISILYGGRERGWTGIPEGIAEQIPTELVVVPELDYDEERDSEIGPKSLATTLHEVIVIRHPQPSSTVLHIHNHSLGKNAALPAAIPYLVECGYAILLQTHDFAEEFRPDNYRHLRSIHGERTGPVSYPQHPRIHYATLNGRDDEVLGRAGIAEERRHRLPNPVTIAIDLPERDAARDRLRAVADVPAERLYALYPVRSIRRKNLGEALLWSALFREELTIGITLEPVNPIERELSKRWQAFAKEKGLPILFGIGEEGQLSFAENLAAADLLLTTSVAEGFGMVFLESWLLGHWLIGRDLPTITRDFREAGLLLGALAERVAIPRDLIDEEGWLADLMQLHDGLRDEYELRPLSEAEVTAELDLLRTADAIDFATLTPDRQRELITRVVQESNVAAKVREANAWMEQGLHPNPEQRRTIIARNRATVEAAYSLESCAERLKDITQVLITAQNPGPAEPLASADRILNEFLRLSRLHPTRLEQP